MTNLKNVIGGIAVAVAMLVGIQSFAIGVTINLSVLRDNGTPKPTPIGGVCGADSGDHIGLTGGGFYMSPGYNPHPPYPGDGGAWTWARDLAPASDYHWVTPGGGGPWFFSVNTDGTVYPQSFVGSKVGDYYEPGCATLHAGGHTAHYVISQRGEGSEGGGADGADGNDGAAGAAGADGAAGAAGAAGADGAAGAAAPCTPCAAVTDAAVALACKILGENPPASVSELQATSQVIVDTLLISANICEDDCDVSAGIQAAIDAKLNE